MANVELMKELVVSTFGGPITEFRPCAYFDDAMDCIRVVARDCSISETRISPLLTVLEDNYALGGAGIERYVGFTIKGARHFCKQQGIDLNTPVQMTELLDRILAETSEPAVRLAIHTVARPMVQEKKELRTVSFPAAA